jgi:anti-sigma B factor antagonist
MLEISRGENGEILLAGRFDASQVAAANEVFLGLDQGATVDCAGLEYISSAGLGTLLAAQMALAGKGGSLKLVHLRSHIRDVFQLSGFDQIFEIE